MRESVPNSDVRKMAKMEKWRKIKFYMMPIDLVVKAQTLFLHHVHR